MGAWIETRWIGLAISLPMSHPVWVRGLKLSKPIVSCRIHPVAPRVGAWIETQKAMQDMQNVSVAPRVGAWIET